MTVMKTGKNYGIYGLGDGDLFFDGYIFPVVEFFQYCL
jgi:hypothetical protein